MKRLRLYAAILCIASLVLVNMAPASTASATEPGSGNVGTLEPNGTNNSSNEDGGLNNNVIPVQPANEDPENPAVAPADPAEVPLDPEADPVTPSAIDADPLTPSGIDADPTTPSAVDADPLTPSGIDADPTTPSAVDADPLTPSGIDADPETPAPDELPVTFLEKLAAAEKGEFGYSIGYLGGTFYDYVSKEYNAGANMTKAASNDNSIVELLFGDGRQADGLGKANYWAGYGNSLAKLTIGLVNEQIVKSVIGGETIYNHTNFKNEANSRVFSQEYTVGTSNIPFVKQTIELDEFTTVYNYTFDSNYMDTGFVNGGNMTYTRNEEGKGQFFPLNTIPYKKSHIGGETVNGVSNDVHFGMLFQARVKINAASTFTFTGDDDVFVYVDDKLVLDLGGIHDAVTNSTSLADFADGQFHVLTLSFLERGSYKSTCVINFQSFEVVEPYIKTRTDAEVHYYYDNVEDTALETHQYGMLVGEAINVKAAANLKEGFEFIKSSRNGVDSLNIYEAYDAYASASQNRVDVYYKTSEEPTPTPTEEPTPTPTEEPTPTPTEEPTPTPTEDPTPTPTEDPTPTPTEDPTPTPTEDPTPTPTEDPTPTPTEDPTPTPTVDPTPTPTVDPTPTPTVDPTPTPTEDPTPTPEELDLEDPIIPAGDDEEEIEVEDPEVPEGDDEVPKTGVESATLIYGAAAVLQAAGITLFVKSGKNRKKKDEE